MKPKSLRIRKVILLPLLLISAVIITIYSGALIMKECGLEINQPIIPMIIFQIFTVSSIGLNIRTNKKIQTLKEEMFESATLLKLYKTQCSLLDNQLDRLRYIKHEARNQIMLLNLYWQTHDDMKLEKYLKHLVTERLELDQQIYCCNHLINAALNNFADGARAGGIQITLLIQPISDFLPIDDFDLFSLLSNMFANALEACCRIESQANRRIEIYINLNKNYLIITAKNSIQHPLRKAGAQYLTSKKDANYHGIGLRIIQKIAKKYAGDVSIQHDHETFKISVILHLSHQECNVRELHE